MNKRVVKIKSWDTLTEEYALGNFKNNEIRISFPERMKYLCGNIHLIVNYDNLYWVDNQWIIAEHMIDEEYPLDMFPELLV